jgi:hypothetical protein
MGWLLSALLTPVALMTTLYLNNTNYEALHYVIFSRILLLPSMFPTLGFGGQKLTAYTQHVHSALTFTAS